MFEVSSSRGSRHCLKIKAQNPGENLHVPQRLRSLNKNDYRNEKHECNHFTELFSLFPEVTWNLPTWLGDGPTPCNFGARVVTVNANHREPAWLAHILNACISPPDGLLLPGARLLQLPERARSMAGLSAPAGSAVTCGNARCA